MDIRAYTSLSEAEKAEAKAFVEKTFQPGLGRTFQDKWQELLGPAYGHGRDLYFARSEDCVLGSMALVLVEIPVKGEAFMTNFKGQQQQVLDTMLVYAEGLVIKAGAKRLLVGCDPALSLPIDRVLKQGYQAAYNLITLVQERRPNNHKAVSGTIVGINEAMPEEREKDLVNYAHIMTQAFIESPNGATLTPSEAGHALDSGMDLGLFYPGDAGMPSVPFVPAKPLGAYECHMESDTGWIDTLAILPDQQGKGYGRNMLGLVMDKLWCNGPKQLRMTVMDANQHAYKLYLSEGFQVETLYSKWFVKGW